MEKRLLLLIQGNDDLKQVRYECEKCGAEASYGSVEGAGVLFDQAGRFLQVIQIAR
jgi:hypothetical protein